MSDPELVHDRITSGGVIAVLRGMPAGTIEPIGSAIARGGVTAVEVTAESDGWHEQMTSLLGVLADRDVAVGVGTVLDAGTAIKAIDGGADFVVTPSFSEDVVSAAIQADTLVIPGVYTPTEAAAALDLGVSTVKLFPASTAGPGHLRALGGPFPDLSIVPTGGVGLDTVAAFIDAGAVAVGVGGALVSDERVQTRDWDAIEATAAAFVEAVADART